MANFKKPHDDNDDGRLGFLGTAASFAPLGYAAYRVGQRIRNEEQVLVPKEDATLSAVRKAANSLRTPAVPNMQNHLDWMKGYGNASFMRTPHGGEIARLAWTQAAVFAGPRSQGPVGPITDTIKGLPTNQVADALESMMKKHKTGSSLLGPVMRRFRRNFETISQHYTATGQIPHMLSSTYNAPAAVPVSLKELPIWMQPHVTRWQESGVQLRGISKYAREEFAGHANYMLQLEGPHGHSVDLLVPDVHAGTYLEGTSLRTRYIAGQIGVIDPATKKISRTIGSRPEFMLDVFGKSIVPAMQRGNISSTELSRAIGALRTQTLHNVETVPNMPDAIRSQALETYIAKKSRDISLVVPAEEVPKGISPKVWEWFNPYRPPTEVEQSTAMVTNKLFGGTSPGNIAEGHVSTFDISSLFMTPEAMDYSRRLEQFNRRWGLSPRAASMSERLYGKYNVLNTKALQEYKGGAPLPPHLRTVFVDPDIHMEALNRAGIGEGELTITRKAASAMEQQWVDSIHLKDVDKSALEMIQAGKAKDLRPEHIIGTSTETGKILTAGDVAQQEILGATVYSSTGKGDYTTLNVLKTYAMGEHEKFYGVKGMARIQSGQAFGSTLKQFDIQTGFDAIAWADDLRKNAGLHNQQMISNMWEVMTARAKETSLAAKGLSVGTSTPPSAVLQQLVTDPVSFAKQVTQRSMVGNAYSHAKQVEQLMKIAIEEGHFTPVQFGETFGIAPSVLEAQGGGVAKDILGKVLSESNISGDRAAMYQEQMGKGVAYGRTQLWWGGPSRAGTPGSIEPRAFETFRSGAFGAMGEGLASDVVARMNYADPGKLATHNALMRSLGTITGKGDIAEAGKLGIHDISQGYNKKEFQSFIEKGGGYLRLGKGFKDIYVPGSDVFRGMDPFATAGGGKVKGYIPDIYHTIASKGAEMYTDIEAERLSTTGMQKVLQQSVKELWPHTAPGGKGMGGYLRNQVIGSKYLTAVTKAGGKMAPDIQTALIPIGYAEQMIREMQESGMYDESALEDQLTRLRKGEKVGGMVMRHPNISEQSFQLMNFQVAKVDQPVMVLPGVRANVNLQMPGGKEKIKGMMFGPSMGLASDWDGDTIAAFMLEPKLEQQARTVLTNQNSEYTQRWMQHQLRFNVMKAKKGPGAMTLLDLEAKMVADTQKLGIGQRWTPKLSVSISRARAAVLANTEGSKLADAQALFASIEQQSISGKHVSPEQILSNRFTGSLQSLNEALVQGDASQIEEQYKLLFAHNPEAMQLMQSDIGISNAPQLSKKLGTNIPNAIKKLDVTAAAQTIATSVAAFKGSDAERTYELMMARGRPIAMNEVAGMTSKLMKAASPEAGAMSSVVRSVQAASNLISRVGRSAIKNYKPLTLGFAGSLAIATSLSSPSDTIGPGSNLKTEPPKMNPKGGARMDAEPLHPNSPTLGSPSVPPMLHQNRTSLAPGGTSSRVRVSARSSERFDSRRLSSGIASSGVRSINLNIRDNRSNSNPHVMANRLFGR